MYKTKVNRHLFLRRTLFHEDKCLPSVLTKILFDVLNDYGCLYVSGNFH